MAGGSDPQLAIDAAAYWAEYDQLETEEERRALQKRWLLAHGGRIVPRSDHGRDELVGGIYPVRPPEDES